MGKTESNLRIHQQFANCDWNRMGNSQRILVKTLEAIPDAAWGWMVRISRVSWVVGLVGIFVLLSMAAWDRHPPIESVVISATDATVSGATIVSIDVEPDDRSCSRSTYRWLTDSKGVDHFINSESVTAAARAKFFKSLRVGVDMIHVVPMPKGIAPGPATYNSESEFGCNPIQRYWWPIVATYSAPFNIIP